MPRFFRLMIPFLESSKELRAGERTAWRWFSYLDKCAAAIVKLDFYSIVRVDRGPGLGTISTSN